MSMSTLNEKLTAPHTKLYHYKQSFVEYMLYVFLTQSPQVKWTCVYATREKITYTIKKPSDNKKMSEKIILKM